MKPPALYRPNQPAFRQQYAALREQSLTAGALLPGTPGTLQRRRGTGYAYWYRVYYPVPGKQSRNTGRARRRQRGRKTPCGRRWNSPNRRPGRSACCAKLGFQVADKASARALVELHNLGAFEAGLLLAGRLGCLAWLNELGARLRQPAGEPAILPRLALVAPDNFLSQPLAAALPLVSASESASPANGPGSLHLARPGAHGDRHPRSRPLLRQRRAGAGAGLVGDDHSRSRLSVRRPRRRGAARRRPLHPRSPARKRPASSGTSSPRHRPAQNSASPSASPPSCSPRTHGPCSPPGKRHRPASPSRFAHCATACWPPAQPTRICRICSPTVWAAPLPRPEPAANPVLANCPDAPGARPRIHD